MRPIYSVSSLLFLIIAAINSVSPGQVTKPKWTKLQLQQQVPLAKKLKFEPTQEWIQNYFSSRETMAEETARLFRQLGSPNYRKRREAQEKIAALPFVPHSLITENLKAKNPEIKYFIKSVAKKRHDTERMYLHMTVWAISQKRLKGFAQPLLRVASLGDEPFRRLMIPVAVAASVEPKDLDALKKILEKERGGSDSEEDPPVDIATIAAVWGLTVLEKKHQTGQLGGKLVDSDLELKLARGLALLYCDDPQGLKTLLPLLNCPTEKFRVLAERALRATTGKWFGYVGSDDAKKREPAIEGWTKFANQENIELKKFDPVSLVPELRQLGNYLIGFKSSDNKPGLFELAPSGQVVNSYGEHPCFWAQKLTNGNMLASLRLDSDMHVVEINPQGELIWKYPAIGILKCRLKANGNVLICFREDKKIIEVNRDKKIVWGMRLGANVNDVALQPDGVMFLGTDSGVIRVDSSGNESFIFEDVDATGIEILPDGDLLIASWYKRKILQISPSGEKRWELTLSQPAHVKRTLEGNYLVADGSGGFYEYNSKRKLKGRHIGFSGRVFSR